MSEFIKETLVLGMVQTNCYIITNGDTREAIVIDPADDADRLYQYIKSNDLVCKGILLTHGHFDHILAAKELAEKTRVKIYAQEEEAKLLADKLLNASVKFGQEYSLVPDALLKDNEVIELAGFVIRVIHTPGHTAGGACYYFTEHRVLFSGDTLFYESIGRYDLPTSDGRRLLESIRSKLMLLQDEVAVCPGHGPATTIGHERENNYFIRRREND